VQLVGVNESGLESGNEAMTSGRDLPWLQDVPEVDVWSTWAVGYRDVWILDGENRLLTVYNLTEHDLREPANYEELRALLIDAAAR
jgi:hypothetical protein